MRHRLWPVLLVSLALVPAVLHGAIRDLDTLKDIYTTGIDLVVAEHEAKQALGPPKYLGSLDPLRAQLKDAGDLSGFLEVDTEYKRFSARQTLVAKNISTANATLNAIQSRYLQILSGLILEQSQDVQNYSQRYLGYLRRLQIEFTREGKREDAIAVRNEIQRVQDSEVVVAASQVLAEKEAAEIAAQKKPSGVGASLTSLPVAVTKGRELERLHALREEWTEEMAKREEQKLSRKEAHRATNALRKKLAKEQRDLLAVLAQSQAVESAATKRIKQDYLGAVAAHQSAGENYRREDKSTWKDWKQAKYALDEQIARFEDLLGLDPLFGNMR